MAANANTRAGLPKAPTGIHGLDEITDGGLPRGRPTLVCGSAGCGKTLLAMEFLVRGAVDYDEPGVFFAFEETAEELTQNVGSLGFDLDELAASQRIAVEHVRVERSEIAEDGTNEYPFLIDERGIAVLPLTSLGLDHSVLNERISTGIARLDAMLGGGLYRGSSLLVSGTAGTAHSNQIREFLLTGHGIELRDVYVGPDGVLTGSMRLVQEARERAAAEGRAQLLERKRRALEAQVEALRTDFALDESELERLLAAEEAAERRLVADRTEMARSRRADPEQVWAASTETRHDESA